MIQRLFDFVEQRCMEEPEGSLFVAKEQGNWRHYSAREVWDTAKKLAGGLLSLGINNQVLQPEAQEKIAIISPDNPQWMIADIGVQLTGAVLTPIYPTISPHELAYVLSEAEVRIVFINDKDLYDR